MIWNVPLPPFGGIEGGFPSKENQCLLFFAGCRLSQQQRRHAQQRWFERQLLEQYTERRQQQQRLQLELQ